MKFTIIKNSLLLSLFSLLVSMLACSPVIENKMVQDEIEIPDASRDSLIYLGFDILHEKESGQSYVNLVSKVIQQAYLKKDITSAPTIPGNKIRCSLLDANQNVLKSTIVNNPLLEELEYADEDGHDHNHDHNHDHAAHTETLKRTTAKKDRGYFGFRARYSSEVKFVLVELADQNANPELARKFVLNGVK